MCTFFVKKPNQTIKKEHFTAIIDNNPQGFGFVYTTGSKLVIVKSASPDAEKMWSKFCDAVKQYPKSNFIGHGRIATGSNLNNENTHPFLVNKSLAMVHNGILRQFPSTAQKSDTVQYIEQVLRKLPKNFCDSKAIMDMIGRDITSSKFAFLSVDNKVYVVNRHLCVIDFETGVLFSNSNYKDTDWLDYGGQKISKNKLLSYEKGYTKYNRYGSQTKLDFHVDADKGQIEQSSDESINSWTSQGYEYCQDCHDWVESKEYVYDWGLCKHCTDEYGLTELKPMDEKPIISKHYKGGDSNLNYCDDCGVNVASETWDDFRLCSQCVKQYDY